MDSDEEEVRILRASGRLPRSHVIATSRSGNPGYPHNRCVSREEFLEFKNQITNRFDNVIQGYGKLEGKFDTFNQVWHQQLDDLNQSLNDVKTELKSDFKQLNKDMDNRFKKNNEDMDDKFLKLNEDMDNRFKKNNEDMDDKFLKLKEDMDERFMKLEQLIKHRSS